MLCTSVVATRVRPGITPPLIAILWGGFLCPLMIFHSLPLALLCLALGGCSWAPYVPIEASLLQRLIPSTMRGQVFGARLALTTAAASGFFAGMSLAILTGHCYRHYWAQIGRAPRLPSELCCSWESVTSLQLPSGNGCIAQQYKW